MEFKNLKIDETALIAELVRRGARDLSDRLEKSLRSIDVQAFGHDDASGSHIQLTLALDKGAEVTVRSPLGRAVHSLPKLIKAIDELVDCAERVFKDRDNTIGLLREVRSALSRECSKARRRGLPYRALAVSITPVETQSHDLPVVRICLEIIGSMLAAEEIVFAAESAQDVVERFAAMRDVQEQRLAARERLARAGADVMIDAVTLAALDAAQIDRAQIIADLRDAPHGVLDIDLAEDRMVLFVRDGVVMGNVPLGGGMRWREGRLTIPNPSKFSTDTAKGKPLKQLIPHSYFDEGMVITGVSDIGESSWVWVASRPVLLSLRDWRKAA